MNKSEKDYAFKRVSSICRRKESAIKSKFPKANICLTKREKVASIKSGKAKLKKNIDYSSYRLEIEDVFEWPKKADIENAKKLVNIEISSLHKHTTKVKDEIMLGDEEKALKLIREFEKY